MRQDIPADINETALSRAIDSVTANTGVDPQSLSLPGGLPLSDKVVLQLSRTSPQRQRFEVGQVRAGKRPFSVKTDVFDTVHFGEVLSRLARAGGWFNQAGQFALRLANAGGIAEEDRTALAAEFGHRLAACGRLWHLVREVYFAAPAGSAEVVNQPHRAEPRDWGAVPDSRVTIRAVRSALNVAGSFVDKCLRDLPRAEGKWPSRTQAHSCMVRLFEMTRHLRRGRAAVEAPSSIREPGPRRAATHAGSDADALVAVWLAERYLFAGEAVEVVFLPRSHDWSAGPELDCVVDIGGMHEPRLGLFDHKPPARADRGEACAAVLLWEHLLATGKPVGHLRELVQTVHHGDSVKLRGASDLYAASQRDGLHAHIRAVRAAKSSDAMVYGSVREWLERSG